MKKSIIVILISICTAFTVNAQLPGQFGSQKISGLDSLVASFSDVQKDYKYVSPYAVVSDLQIFQNEADSINVSCNVNFYSNVAAFSSKLQPVSNTRINVRLFIDGALPGHYAIKQAIYKALPK